MTPCSKSKKEIRITPMDAVLVLKSLTIFAKSSVLEVDWVLNIPFLGI